MIIILGKDNRAVDAKKGYLANLEVDTFVDGWYFILQAACEND